MTEKHDVIVKFLKECDDIELLDVINSISSEVKERLLGLFKENDCTSIEFWGDDVAFLRVNDMYGNHSSFGDGCHSRDVDVKLVGYTNVFSTDGVYPDVLYVVTDKNEEFSGDEIDEDSLYDLYRETKDKFSKLKNGEE